MPDIPIDQAMNGLGMGGMSTQDFISGLAASIVDKVGPSKPYGKEKTSEQQQLEKQLKQMEELTDGLEDLTETLKTVQKVMEDTKRKAKESSPSTGSGEGFGNLTASLGKLFGGPGTNKDLSPLETTTFQKLAKMADEGVKNRCLGVKDTVMWAKMDVLIEQIKSLNKFFTDRAVGGRGRKGGPGSTGGPDPTAAAATGPGGLPVVGGIPEAGKAGIPEAAGVPEMGKAAAEAASTTEELSAGDKLFGDMKKKAGEWARKLKVGEATILQLLERTKEIYGTDVEILHTLETSLDRHHQAAEYHKQNVSLAGMRLDKEVKLGRPLAANADQADRFLQSLLASGQSIKANNNFLQQAQQRLQTLNAAMQVLNPQQMLGGPTLDFNIKKAAQLGSNAIAQAGQISYAIGGAVGDITKQTGSWQRQMLDDFVHAQDEAIKLGTSMAKMTEIQSRAARRGITTGTKQVAHDGILLAKSIGADIDATSDELMNWVQRFQLSNVQASFLAKNIKNVGSVTGVTGNNLLNAVKSAAQLAENMRSAGNYTEEAGRFLIQMAATAQKLGTEKLVNPLTEGLQSRRGFLNMEDRQRSFLVRSATQGGVGVGALNVGEAMNPQNRAGMIRGMQSELARFESMLAAGVPKAIVNAQVEAQTGMAGLGDLQRAVKTFVQGNETAAQKMERLQLELAQNTNATSAERKALEDQIKQQEKNANVTIPLQQLSNALSEEMPGGNRRNLDQALAASGQSREQVETALRRMMNESGVSSINQGGINATSPDEIIRQAMSSGGNLREVMSALQDAEKEKAKKDIPNTDPVSKSLWEINKLQETFNKFVQDSWLKLLERIPPGAIAGLVGVAAFGVFASSVIGGLTAIVNAVAMISSGLGSLFGGGGAAAVGGTIGTVLIAALMPVLGGVLGYMQAEDAKRTKTEATMLGVLTGSATKESYTGGALGIEKGSKKDQLLGMGEGTAWGAAAGAIIGTAIAPGIGTAIGAVIGGVLGLGGSVYKLLTDKTSAFFSQGFVDALDKAGKALSNVWDGIVGLFKGIWDGIMKIFEGIGSVFSDFMDGIGPDTIYMFDQIFTGVIELFNWAAPYLKIAGEWLGWFFKDIIGEGLRLILVNIVGPAFKFIGQVIGTVFKGIGGVIEWLRKGTGPFADGLKRIGGWLAEIPEAWKKYISDPWDKFWTEAAETWKKYISDPWDKFWAEAAEAWKKYISDPWNKFWAEAAETWKKYISDPWDKFWAEATMVFNFAANSLRESFNAVVDWLKNKIDGILNPKVTTTATPEAVAAENARRATTGEAPLPTAPGAVQMQQSFPGGVLNARNWSDDSWLPGAGWIGRQVRGYAEGTKEIQRTGLAMLHQGEMVVPKDIARHLTSAEGSGPFQDAIALVKPGSNESMMQNRIQTEFSGSDPSGTVAQANQHLNDLNDYNRQQTEMMKQELEVLRAILARLSSPQQGIARGDTSSNSRPAQPPQYYEWAVRPLNSPNYGGVENTVRG